MATAKTTTKTPTRAGTKPKAPTAPCHCCRGTGRIPLSGVYLETWELLRSQRGRPINGAGLARLSGVKATAVNNRLVALERLGLARGERYGRERRWVAIVAGD